MPNSVYNPAISSNFTVKDDQGNIIERFSTLTDVAGTQNQIDMTVTQGKIQAALTNSITVAQDITAGGNITATANLNATGDVNAANVKASNGLWLGAYQLVWAPIV